MRIENSSRPNETTPEAPQIARGSKRLENARFADDPKLERIRSGRGMLRAGASGPAVTKVQEALIDLGFAIEPGGASGTFDEPTRRAVIRFQREVGLGDDGRVGKDTLRALDGAAPPPDKRLVRSAEYDRLYADGRLDVTVAVGFDERGAHGRKEKEILAGLAKRGFRPVRTADKARLGLVGERDDPNARFFTKSFVDPKTKQDVDAVVRLVAPKAERGATARDSFERGVEQDEVVIYSGHARYGTGPDFDHIESGAGNFVVDPEGNEIGDKPPRYLREALKGRTSDLPKVDQHPDYQLMIMNGCTTENYVDDLRDARAFKGRDNANTDIISTTMVTLTRTGGDHALRFLDGVTKRESNPDLLKDQNMIEFSALMESFDLERAVRSNGTYTENGFLGNSTNVEVPKSGD